MSYFCATIYNVYSSISNCCIFVIQNLKSPMIIQYVLICKMYNKYTGIKFHIFLLNIKENNMNTTYMFNKMLTSIRRVLWCQFIQYYVNTKLYKHQNHTHHQNTLWACPPWSYLIHLSI